jgi:hypothetical protein
VDSLGDKLFSGSRFPFQQNDAVIADHGVDNLHELLECGASTDEKRLVVPDDRQLGHTVRLGRHKFSSCSHDYNSSIASIPPTETRYIENASRSSPGLPSLER